jgi:hypothetical protein
VRHVAAHQGLVASLAPKPAPEQAGNSAHIHWSVWDTAGENNLLYEAQDPYRLSQMGYHFIAGVLAHLPGLLALTTPSYNSYRRLQPHFWSSAYTCWGPDNREASERSASGLWGQEAASTNLELKASDPVLRVRTDPAIVSVTALFPFGLVKKLKYLVGEDIWQTRFVAPTDMDDGEHDVRLVLRDREGRVYRESKSFIIASKPPVVRVHLDKTQYRRGETIELKVSASKSTRTLVARLYGAAPVELRWNEKAKYNTGTLVVPGHLPAGEYKLLVTAEDFAHNIGAQEVSLAVAP